MSEAVRLTVVPDTVHVVPGGQVSLSLTVENTGSSGTRCHLAVDGIPDAWCELAKRQLTLGPGVQEQVQLTVQPPDTATVDGSYPLTVRVTSPRRLTTRCSGQALLAVGTEDGLTMDVAPADVEGRKACFHITYLNLSQAPVAVALVARDHENGLRFSAEPDAPVIVPAGGGGPVTVHVVPKVRKTIGEPHPYEIEFRGVQLGAEQATHPCVVRRARFVYVPRYTARYLPVWLRRAPRWAVLLPCGLLLLLLAFAGGHTLASPATRTAVTPMRAPTRGASATRPGRGRPQARVMARTVFASLPSIRRFTLVHRHQGRPYELVWQTSDASHVTLDGRPVSTRGSLVLSAPLRSATHGLAATNGARRATAHVHVVVDARTTDTHALLLTTLDIATFAVHRRKGKLYVGWRVRDAVDVRLQGRLVAHAGDGLVPPGVSWLRLVARNDVGIRQRLLHLAGPMPAAMPRPRSTATPTAPPRHPHDSTR
jgi:hypothetical protein